jgi:endoglucanase
MKKLVLSKTLFATVALMALGAPAQAYTVSNGRIVDDAGKTINLRGVNWFGLETTDNAPHGLWARNYQDMLRQMKSLGFNAVRVPVCPNTLNDSPTQSINFSLNPTLQFLSGLQVLDKLIDELEAQGMYYLLDHHRPDCKAISELWYTAQYSEAQWISDLEFMAKRYKSRKYFIGIDHCRRKSRSRRTQRRAQPTGFC